MAIHQNPDEDVSVPKTAVDRLHMEASQVHTQHGRVPLQKKAGVTLSGSDKESRMGETWTRPELGTVTDIQGNVSQTQRLLQIVYGVFPIVIGLDKFTHFLVEWPKYLPPVIAGLLPFEPGLFMHLVGVIEIAAGLIVLWRAEYGAYLVAAWLTAIAATQVIAGNYDIAVRDFWIAVGAVALTQLTAARKTS